MRDPVGELLTRRRRAFAWLVVAAALGAATFFAWPGPGWLRTDVRALLPGPDAGPGRAGEAMRSLAEPFERTTLWLVGADGPAAAAAAARRLGARLRDTGVFRAVSVEVRAERMRALARALQPYRHGLLTPAAAARLESDPAGFVRQRLAQQYSLTGATAGSLASDPLGLFGDYLRNAVAAVGGGASATAFDGVVVVEGPGRHYGLVTADARDSAFRASAAPPLLPVWRDAIAWAEAQGLRLHATGAPLYSAHASASAHREIMLIGGVSLLAIALLLVARFRSLRPLGVTLVTVGAGVGGGFATALLVFGELHLVTLVFGATVIGVSVDYTFHYLSDSLRPGWTPEAGLRHIMPALRLALATSVIAFLSLALAPFPVLRQVATFTAGGLVASWLTVVLLLPVLVRPAAGAPALRPPRLRLPRRPGVVAIAVLVLAGPGILLLEPTDDVRLLYTEPERLGDDDAAIAALLPRPDSNRFLLVSGDSGQALLRRLEGLRPGLDGLAADGAIDGHASLAALVPSHARQRANERLLRELAASGRYAGYLRTLGFGPGFVEERLAAVREPGPYLDPDAALSAAGERYRSLWLGCRNDGCAAIVTLTGAGEGKPVAAFAADRAGVRWVDRIGAINEAMRDHRRISLVLLLVALAAVAATLALTLGPRRGLRVTAVPALALVVSLGTIGYSGAMFSVFNFMALLLVLGVGIDYALFYHRARPEGQPAAALGIGMAALTTMLAFGLLVFSATPVINAFGTTLLPGLAAAYALAFATADGPPRDNPDTSA